MTETTTIMPEDYDIKFTSVSECLSCGIQRESMKIEDYWLFEEFYKSKNLDPFDYMRDLRVNGRTASYRHGSMVTSDLFGGSHPDADKLQREFVDWFFQENGCNAFLKYGNATGKEHHCRYCAQFI